MPDNEDRIRQFDTKFSPKGGPSMANLIAQIREQAQAALKLCEEMDRIVAASESDTRKAADLLIGMAGRIK